jgi:hypothetical protein
MLHRLINFRRDVLDILRRPADIRHRTVEELGEAEISEEPSVAALPPGERTGADLPGHIVDVGDRLVQLALAQLRTDTFPIRVLLLGGRTVVNETIDEESIGMIDLTVQDIDLTVTFDHSDIIQTLRFADDHLEVRLAIPSVGVTASWFVAPNDHWVNGLLAFLTGGISVIASTHFGRLVTSGSDVELAFVLRPEFSEGRIQLRGSFDGDASRLTWAILLFDFSPSAIPEEGIAQVIVNSIHHPIETEVLEWLTGKINAFLEGEVLEWPKLWNLIDGPRYFPTALLFGASPGYGVFEADQRELGGFPRPVRPTPVGESAFVFSPELLTAWLRSITGAEATVRPLERLPGGDTLLRDLPDPSTLPSPPTEEPPDLSEIEGALGVECGPPPPPVTLWSRNFAEVRRGPLVVELPEDPPRSSPFSFREVTIAGWVRLSYEVSIEAMRSRLVPEPVVLTEYLSEAEPEMGPGSGRGLPRGLRTYTCYWENRERRERLASYLFARINVEADLLIDFHPHIGIFLPGLRLYSGVDEDGNGLRSTVETLDATGPLVGIDPSELNKLVREIALNDARMLLAPARRPTDAGQLIRNLLPVSMWVSISAALRSFGGIRLGEVVNALNGMLTWTQDTPLTGATDDLVYRKADGLLYWPHDVQITTGGLL